MSEDIREKVKVALTALALQYEVSTPDEIDNVLKIFSRPSLPRPQRVWSNPELDDDDFLRTNNGTCKLNDRF